MHENQIAVDPQTVHRLVTDQFPQWRQLPIQQLGSTATVNSIFLLGEELTARFPLVLVGVDEARSRLVTEAMASEELSAVCPFPAPRPVALGKPGHGYPLPWSIQTWVPGSDATVEDPATSIAFVDDLVRLIRGLRSADTRGRTFSGQGRGGSLPDHDAWMETCFRNSEHLLDVPRLRELWSELRRLPEVDADAMCHGDLTPPNVLVKRGRLAGILDTGGFAAADPALDLVACWHLLGHETRRIIRKSLSCSDTQWRRGMAWAFQQSVGLVWYYEHSNPVMSALGRRTLDRIIQTPD